MSEVIDIIEALARLTPDALKAVREAQSIANDLTFPICRDCEQLKALQARIDELEAR